MAIGAHKVQVFLRERPVQLVVVRDSLVRIKVEPTLPAGLFGARVPRDRQRLNSTVRKLDEVLLQRRDTEGVLDLKICLFAVATLGVDEKFLAPLEESAADAGMRKSGAGKIAQ